MANDSGFNWSGGTLSGGGKPPEEKGWKERLRSPVAMAAAFVVVLVAGGALFSLTAMGVAGPGGEGVIGELPGAGDRRAFKNTSRRLGAGREDSRKDRMQFDAIAAKERAGGGGLDGVVADEALEEGVAPMQYAQEGGSGGGRSVSGGIAPGSTASKSGGGAAAAGVSTPYPKLAGNAVSMQGMRKISGTAGFRGLSSGRSVLRRIGSRGTSTEGPGGGSGAGFGAAGGGGAGDTSGGAAGGSGMAAMASEGESDTAPGSGSGGGGGGGSGGGELGEMPETPQQRIERLMGEAADLEKKADKEKKYAQAQAAGGHMGPAQYHYDRSKKYRAQSRKKSGEAMQLIAETQSAAAEAGGATTPTNTGPGVQP